MKVEISFTIGTSDKPDHRSDARLRKVFDVQWSGRPMLGETIELDIGHPISEESFEFAGAYWNVVPSQDGSTAYFWLKRVVVAADDFEWEDGFNGYAEYVKKHGWDVFGGWGLGRRKAA
jgi:hypothetical protein